MLGAFLALLNTPEEKSRFEHLYITYKSVLKNYAMEILNDPHLAEDAVHDAFMQLTKYMDRIKDRNDREASNYLIIITKNEAKRIYNDRKRIVYQEDMIDFDEECVDVEDIVALNEMKQHIMEIVKAIDPKYGDPLMLRYFYGFKDKEVAAMLRISLENEKIRLHRGKEMVKKQLKREKEHDREPV